MNVGIACGGTCGHIFPGLATALVLRKRAHEVTLWLTGREVENTSLEDWDGRTVSIPATGFQGGLSLRSIFILLRLCFAYGECLKRMKRNRPDILLAMGSYASVGPVLAARRLRIPVVLHESNAVPGRANSSLARFASIIALAFEPAAVYLPHSKIVITGFPVRSQKLSPFKEDMLHANVFTVLVMGGSQGAHQLNKIASATLSRLCQQRVPIQVVHLAGDADEALVRRTYEKAGIKHVVFSFLKDMGRAYASADLSISRSGAATCAEISVYAIPSLLVPLPSAIRDHQMANARAMQTIGAADLVEEKELSIEWLADYIDRSRLHPEKLDRMRNILKTIAVPDAAEKLADVLEKAASGRPTS